MPVFADMQGQRRAVSSTPANTSEATLFTASGNNVTFAWLHIANTTASAANATVKWGDGSTDYSIIDTYSVPGRGFVTEELMIPLRDGYTIKITSGTADALTFTVVVAEGASAFGKGGMGVA